MSEDLQPYGQRGLAHALSSQVPAEQQPKRRRTEHFTAHLYCGSCITSWGMDLKALLNPRQLAPVVQQENRVCENCGNQGTCYLIHETEQATQLRNTQQMLADPGVSRGRKLYEVYRTTRIELHLGVKPIFDELTPAQQALWVHLAHVSL